MRHQHHLVLRGALCALLLLLVPPANAAPQEAPKKVILLTHPRATVLQGYIDMVRQHILDIPNVRFVGIYHASETESYQDARDLLSREHIDWITLQAVDCPLGADEIFKPNACSKQFADLVAESDGAVFNGGPDIPPSIYGKPTLLTTIIESPHRHVFEISLLAHMLGTGKNPALPPLIADRVHYPVLAICVGMQSMNVADGGTLLQDIPSEVYGVHTREELLSRDPNTLHHNVMVELDPEPGVSGGVFHPIRVLSNAGATLLPASDAAPLVFSVHHQAVDKLGPHYNVVATSLDGKIIEAIAHKAYPHVIGLQFHPERPYMWDPNDVARRAADDVEKNFVYNTLQRDPKSRAFNTAVWHAFSQAVSSVEHPKGSDVAHATKMTH